MGVYLGLHREGSCYLEQLAVAGLDRSVTGIQSEINTTVIKFIVTEVLKKFRV